MNRNYRNFCRRNFCRRNFCHRNFDHRNLYHPHQLSHPERSDGPMHSFSAEQNYIGPSHKSRAQEDKKKILESRG